jgi:hypothetical protein
VNVGVMLYTSVCGVLELFEMLCEPMVLVVPLAAKFDKFELPKVFQINEFVPPLVVAVNETEDKTPLQTV